TRGSCGGDLSLALGLFELGECGRDLRALLLVRPARVVKNVGHVAQRTCELLVCRITRSELRGDAIEPAAAPPRVRGQVRDHPEEEKPDDRERGAGNERSIPSRGKRQVSGARGDRRRTGFDDGEKGYRSLDRGEGQEAILGAERTIEEARGPQPRDDEAREVKTEDRERDRPGDP